MEYQDWYLDSQSTETTGRLLPHSSLMKTIESTRQMRIPETSLEDALEFEAPNKTKTDVAKFLGVTVRTVESMMVRSGLPFYRLGTRRVRFRLADVLKWMDERNRVS